MRAGTLPQVGLHLQFDRHVRRRQDGGEQQRLAALRDGDGQRPECGWCDGPLRSQIARQLRNRILSGDLPEGREIPPAHRFRREHRVSPREVEGALSELAGEGLIEQDGDAVRVAPVTVAHRRELAQRRLLDDLRQQELSLRELEADARLLLFSDGLPEARRASGEPLGYDGLANLLASPALATTRLGPLAWIDEVLEAVQRLTGPALDDDWTAVAVARRHGPAPDAEPADKAEPAGENLRPVAGGRA